MTWTDRVSVWSGQRCSGDRKSLPAVTGLTFVTVAAVSMGGCTGDPTPAQSTPLTTSSLSLSTGTSQALSPSFVPSPGPSADAAKAALRVYQKYWDAQIEAQADPQKAIGPSLKRYSTGSARTDIEATVLLFRQQGIEMRGRPVLAPRVTAVRLGDRPQVSITDCVDSSNWRPVYARNGKSALAPDQSPRVVMDSVAIVSNGRWLIETSSAHRDRTC